MISNTALNDANGEVGGSRSRPLQAVSGSGPPATTHDPPVSFIELGDIHYSEVQSLCLGEAR